MKKTALAFLFWGVLITSCKEKKTLPQPAVTEPHFYAQCQVDGEPLYIVAGNEDYYMNSSWYYSDSNAIFVYKGHLAKQTGNGYQLTVLIHDYKNNSAQAVMSVDSALRTGDHLYYDKNQEGLTQSVVFTPVKQVLGSALYGWSVTDGQNIKDYPAQGTEHYSITPVLEIGKTYSVSLRYNDGLGVCEAAHTNVYTMGAKIQTTVSAARDSNSADLLYTLTYTTSSYSPYYKCRWDFADNSSSENVTVVKAFPEGKSLIKLTVKNELTGDSCVSYYQLNATSGAVCDANYTAQFLPIQNFRLYSSVIILLTDPNGNVYSSQGLIQPQESSFELMSSTNYQKNSLNQPTKRLRIKFNCILKNNNQEIRLTNGEAVIAVAYK